MRWRSVVYYAAVCALLVLLGWSVRGLITTARGGAPANAPSTTTAEGEGPAPQVGLPTPPGGLEGGAVAKGSAKPAVVDAKKSKGKAGKGAEPESYSRWIPPEKRPWWAREGKGPWINPDVAPEVKKRLAEIFASGSDERPEFTLTEKYSDETIKRIGELVPGPVGVMLQETARRYSQAPDPHYRARPWLDAELCLHYGDFCGDIMVAIDQYGFPMYQSPEYAGPTLGEVAATLAHRIQAGDEPRWKPPADWKRWVKDSVLEWKYQEWVRRGLIPEE